ncbi:Ima1 N-terminal domain-containing protein [Schizophyllum commune]
MFRAQKPRTCHFCGQPQETTQRHTKDFRCRNCTCWNRFDAHGEILSSEPAMHEESMNARSFSKRASPSKDRLPTQYSAGQFCHTCQTNQTLLNRMLSNYLPSEDSPDYKEKLAALPDYQAYAERKFPPLCASCAPAVEELIRQKEQMARSHALSVWAKESKGKQRVQKTVRPTSAQKGLNKQLALWRLRGMLYGATTLAFIAANTWAAMGYAPYHKLPILWPALPILVLLSIWYTAWDPTYASLRRAQVQGQEVRLRGRGTHIALQLFAWFSRLLSSCLLAVVYFKPQRDYLHLLDHPQWSHSLIYFRVLAAIEFTVLIASCFVPRLTRPPTIRLIDTKAPLSRASSMAPPSTHPAQPAETFSEPDLIASLSLGGPSIPTSMSAPRPNASHIFGQPSLGPQRTPVMDEDEMAMDWTPTDPAAARRQRRDEDDGSYIRPQRFFAPEQPTGLEGLLEKTRLEDVPMEIDSSDHVANVRDTIRRLAQRVAVNWQVCLLVLGIPVLLAMGWRMWVMREAAKVERVVYVEVPAPAATSNVVVQHVRPSEPTFVEYVEDVVYSEDGSVSSS